MLVLRRTVHDQPGVEGWVGLTTNMEVWAGRVHADDDMKLLLHLRCEERVQALTQHGLRGNGALQGRQGAIQLLVGEQTMDLHQMTARLGAALICSSIWVLVCSNTSCVEHHTVQYSTVQYSTVQYSTVQYSTVQYSTVQYRTVQCSAVQ